MLLTPSHCWLPFQSFFPLKYFTNNGCCRRTRGGRNGLFSSGEQLSTSTCNIFSKKSDIGRLDLQGGPALPHKDRHLIYPLYLGQSHGYFISTSLYCLSVPCSFFFFYCSANYSSILLIKNSSPELHNASFQEGMLSCHQALVSQPSHIHTLNL